MIVRLHYKYLQWFTFGVSHTQPKYFHALKKAAERRKLEGDLVYEHQAQRELEKEEQDFADKESFVTSGYKKKLQERKVLEEELAKEAAQEGVNLICEICGVRLKV